VEKGQLGHSRAGLEVDVSRRAGLRRQQHGVLKGSLELTAMRKHYAGGKIQQFGNSTLGGFSVLENEKLTLKSPFPPT